MRKIIISLIAVLSIILIAFFGWYFFVRDQEVPLGETIRNILPFGSGEDIQLPVDSKKQTVDSDESFVSDEFGVPTAKLFRISREPVAGVVVLNTRSTGSTSSGQGGTSTVVVRYVDRATGHIYDTDLATLVKTKVTNQTLPKIYEAYFRPDGNAVLLRSLKDNSDVIENLSLTLTPPQATVSTSSPQASTLYAVSSNALRGNIGTIAVGSGNTLIYTLRDTSSVVSSAFNGTGAKTLFTSPFTDWRLIVAGKNLVLYTKASVNAPGYAYTLNTSNGALAKILGPLNGLIVVPNASGDRALYSYTESGETRSFVKNLQSGALSEILPTTLAEKCIWGTKSVGLVFCAVPVDDLGTGEPDNWYRGTTHFSDRIWLFDTNTDIAQVLVEPKQSLGIDIDVFEPRLSPDEDYLVFINKNDLSLWALKIQ